MITPSSLTDFLLSEYKNAEKNQIQKKYVHNALQLCWFGMLAVLLMYRYQIRRDVKTNVKKKEKCKTNIRTIGNTYAKSSFSVPPHLYRHNPLLAFPSQLLARQLLNASGSGFLRSHMYKSVGSRFYNLAFDCLVQFTFTCFR